MTRFDPTRLALKAIRIDDATRPGAPPIDDDEVAWHVRAIREGRAFPSPIVFYDGSKYWLATDHAYVLGAIEAGLRKIEVEISPGDLRDAVMYAINVATPSARSNREKRQAVMTLLTDEVWSQWSDRAIAGKLRVGNRLVSDLRRELSRSTVSEPQEPKVRKFRRNGQIRAMEVGRINAGRPHSSAVAVLDGPSSLTAEIRAIIDAYRDREGDPGAPEILRALAEVRDAIEAGEVRAGDRP